MRAASCAIFASFASSLPEACVARSVGVRREVGAPSRRRRAAAAARFPRHAATAPCSHIVARVAQAHRGLRGEALLLVRAALVPARRRLVARHGAHAKLLAWGPGVPHEHCAVLLGGGADDALTARLVPRGGVQLDSRYAPRRLRLETRITVRVVPSVAGYRASDHREHLRPGVEDDFCRIE
jgi:hypothetical protein